MAVVAIRWEKTTKGHIGIVDGVEKFFLLMNPYHPGLFDLMEITDPETNSGTLCYGDRGLPLVKLGLVEGKEMAFKIAGKEKDEAMVQG
jgi:hypothetical protein